MKTIFWVDSSKEAVKSFPADVRRKTGHELGRVQHGLEPTDWKPMSSIGAGVKEIRMHDGSGYRVIYIAKFEEGIYVLHAFRKQSVATARKDIALARRRFRSVIESRRTL
jgi:phage-related protein